VPSSSVLTSGTPDANGANANFTGSVKIKVINGNAATEANEANVQFVVAMTDVRNKPSLSDYTGKVLVSAPLKITDQQNADEQPAPGTTQTLPYEFPVTCTATADTTTGSTCNLTTTANAITPGGVIELKRSIWEFGQLVVRDAGPNGTGYAACPPTCGDGDESDYLRAGIFVP
jgi:hypothetical protein